MQQRLFFNSSLPRAGSTLLSNIVGHHPHFYVSPTSALILKSPVSVVMLTLASTSVSDSTTRRLKVEALHSVTREY